jgi:hypothetical protein
MWQVRAFLIVSAFLLLPSVAVFASPADLSASLPLGPYFRPGKYLPVRLTGSFPEESNYWVAVAAANVKTRDDIPRGAGRTSVNLRQGRLDAVVPWLVMDKSARHPRLVIENCTESADGPPLVELTENHRLIGYTVTFGPMLAKELVPAATDDTLVSPVPLDPAGPIKGHACAYEVLDAIVLDDASAARLGPNDIPNLLACGIAVAIQTTRPPLPNWPWRQVGEFAVLRHDLIGPATAGYHPDAYLPVSDWQAGWPWPFRRRVLLAGAICCALLLALALWRPPLVALWAGLLIVAMLVAIGRWWSVHIPIQQAAGEVIVLPPQSSGGLTQTDAWTYQTATAPRAASLQWSDVARPVFATDAGVNDVWISLNCDPAGQPREFFTRVPANRKIAFLSRTVGPAAPKTPPGQPVTSPLKSLVDAAYTTRPGLGIRGELRTTAPSMPAYGTVEVQQWPAVVVAPEATTPSPTPPAPTSAPGRTSSSGRP